MRVCVCVCMYVCARAYMCVCECMHACMHTLSCICGSYYMHPYLQTQVNQFVFQAFIRQKTETRERKRVSE